MFIICSIQVMFAIAMMPIMGSPNKGGEGRAEMSVVLKGAVEFLVVILTLFLTNSFQNYYGTQFSSIAVGLFFLGVTAYYMLDIASKEMKEKESVCVSSLRHGKMVQIYNARACCTLPPILYLVLFDLNPTTADYVFNSLLLLCICLLIAMQGIEIKRFELADENNYKQLPQNQQEEAVQNELERIKLNNPFRTEKLVYLLATVLLVGIFFTTLVYAGNFYQHATISYAAPYYTQMYFKAFFYTKLGEFFLSIMLYVCDQYETFNYRSHKASTYVEGDRPVEIMKKSSTFRYFVLSTADFILLVTFLVIYLQHRDDKPDLLQA